MNRLFRILIPITVLLTPFIASAHEAYVLTKDQFNAGLQSTSLDAFSALQNPANLLLTLKITVGVLLVFGLNALFRRSHAGQTLHATLERLAPLGPLFVRAAIAISLFYSALSWSFLGPELSLQSMPWPTLMRALLFIVSAFFALGLFTEVAAAVAFAIFTIGFFVFHAYLLTYLNYFGEIVVLLVFGMRSWSLDRVLFGPARRYLPFKKYDTAFVRICYGIALCYAAITIKLIHPILTVTVVNQYHLTQFHWLFPSDPLLVTLGAALAEFAIGLFIILGFELRLTVLISLFYITLSLIYFRELVWPHLLLYGISLNLLVNHETFTLDALLFPFKRASINAPTTTTTGG